MTVVFYWFDLLQLSIGTFCNFLGVWFLTAFDWNVLIPVLSEEYDSCFLFVWFVTAFDWNVFYWFDLLQLLIGTFSICLICYSFWFGRFVISLEFGMFCYSTFYLVRKTELYSVIWKCNLSILMCVINVLKDL